MTLQNVKVLSLPCGWGLGAVEGVHAGDLFVDVGIDHADAVFADDGADRVAVVAFFGHDIAQKGSGRAQRLVDSGGKSLGQHEICGASHCLFGQMHQTHQAFFDASRMDCGDDKMACGRSAQNLLGGARGSDFPDKNITRGPAQRAFQWCGPVFVFADLNLIAITILANRAVEIIFDRVFDGDADSAEILKVICEQSKASCCFSMTCCARHDNKTVALAKLSQVAADVGGKG